MHDKFSLEDFWARVKSDHHLQKFAGRVWGFLKRDADQFLSHELLLAHIRAAGWVQMISAALDKIDEYEQVMNELGVDLPSDFKSQPGGGKLSEEGNRKIARVMKGLSESPPCLDLLNILSGEGPAEAGSTESGLTLPGIREGLFAEMDRQKIRGKTCRSMVICLDHGVNVPAIEGKEWVPTVQKIENIPQEEGKGNLTEAYDGFFESEEVLGWYKGTFEMLQADLLRANIPLLLEDLRNGYRKHTTVFEAFKDRYKKNRENEQYHAAAESDYRRLMEKACSIDEALNLLTTFDELYPEWKERALLAKDRMKENQFGAVVAPELPGSAQKWKKRLRKRRNELKVRGGAKAALVRWSGSGESLPEWEEFIGFFVEEEDSTPETIHERRCQAVAALDPENIDSVKEMADQVAEAIGDPQTSASTLTKSLQKLTLESGEEVFFTHGDHATREDRKEERQIRVERARKWCEEHDLTY